MKTGQNAKNLLINSFTTKDQELSSLVFNYDDHVKEFVNFCNSNRLIWMSSDNAPKLRFTEPIKHETLPGMWVTELLSDDDLENYGFLPDQESQFELETTPELEPEPEPEAAPKEIEDKKEIARQKAQEREVKIKELEIELEKTQAKTIKQTEKLAKARTKQLAQADKLLSKYERYYKQGIITKAEFKKKIMELEL